MLFKFTTTEMKVAEEFNKWLNEMSEKFGIDKDDIQEMVKSFLVG